MKRFFSDTTNGFYRDDLHTPAQIPMGAVEVSEVEFTDLIDGQASGEKVIGSDEGFPVLLDPIAPPTIQLAQNARIERTRLLSECDWTQLPDAQLTPEEILTWATYRQNLRDITDQALFPTTIDWPIAPDAL